MRTHISKWLGIYLFALGLCLMGIGANFVGKSEHWFILVFVGTILLIIGVGYTSKKKREEK